MMRREPLVINSSAEARALGIAVFAGTDPSKSSMFVPIVASDRVLGTIVLENYQRENAYGEAEVRLLRTVASGMGVAIENARLFAETQRLLKETEQRNAELAVINSIQHGMAAELDFKAIVDLVGEKLRELFSFANLGIAWLDEPAGLLHFLYVVELGKRLQLAPAQLAVVATGKRYFQTLASRQSVVWRDRDEYRSLELFVAEGSAMSRSGVTTPFSPASGSSDSSRSRIMSATALSATPTSACSRPSRPAWGWRSRTRGCSTRRSGARARPRRSSRSAATFRRRSTFRR